MTDLKVEVSGRIALELGDGVIAAIGEFNGKTFRKDVASVNYVAKKIDVLIPSLRKGLIPVYGFEPYGFLGVSLANPTFDTRGNLDGLRLKAVIHVGVDVAMLGEVADLVGLDENLDYQLELANHAIRF